MAFPAAVIFVCVFGGLSIYCDAQGQQGLRWLCFVVAVIMPWVLGMTLNRGGQELPQDDEARVEEEQ